MDENILGVPSNAQEDRQDLNNNPAQVTDEGPEAPGGTSQIPTEEVEEPIDEPEEEVEEKYEPQYTADDARAWFEEDEAAMYNWRELARTDYDFYASKQWDDGVLDELAEADRPANTLNVIRPLINLLSGYQRLNRYDPKFLSRNLASSYFAEIRQGVTKYILDGSDYDSVESAVCLDAWICGLGWYKQWYTWDFAKNEAAIIIEKASPFDVYPDMNSIKPGFKDAQRIHEAHWKDKDELKSWYPEHAEDIDSWADRYDDEKDCFGDQEKFWYQPDENKCRLVETWWYEISTRPYYQLSDGTEVLAEEITPDKLPFIVETVDKPYRRVMYAAFIGGVTLEGPREWQTNDFPLTAQWCYYLGEGDEYCGVVRDLLDSQREINKRRSDMIQILNTNVNSAWQAEAGALSDSQRIEYEENGAKPGTILEHRPGHDAPKRVDTPPLPSGIMEAESISRQDIYSISNINPSTMGSQLTGASGRAIEMQQKQANTGTVILFDNLRMAKKTLMIKLWGQGSNPGLVQKFYNDEQTIRIMDDSNHMQFITVNQKVTIPNPMLGPIKQTLNDLSVGEFDIVISETPATATQKMSQFWSMVDAVGQMGIPWDMVYDLILDLSEIPNKDEIKARIAKRMEQKSSATDQQAQAIQALQNKPNPPKISVSVPYKELPPNEQMQMATKVGLQPSPADYGIQTPQSTQPAEAPQAQVPTERDLARSVLTTLINTQHITAKGANPLVQGQAPSAPAEQNPELIRQRYLNQRPTQNVHRAEVPLAATYRG